MVERFLKASEGFARALRRVGSWSAPTPCTDWDVRALANHVAQGNLNYVRLLDGASAQEFLRWRDADALGDEPAAPTTPASRPAPTPSRRPEPWRGSSTTPRADLSEIYAGMGETPIAQQSTHRFFAAPTRPRPGANAQDRLLHLFGRTP